MADVLRRGPVGDDDAIKRELPLLWAQLDRRLPRLTYVDAAGSVAFAGYLESVANRLLDMSDAINARYLAHGVVERSTEDEPEREDEIL